MGHQTWSSVLPGCKVRGVWFRSWPLGPLWLQGVSWSGWGRSPHCLGSSRDQPPFPYDQLGSGGLQSSLRSTFCPQGGVPLRQVDLMEKSAEFTKHSGLTEITNLCLARPQGLGLRALLGVC